MRLACLLRPAAPEYEMGRGSEEILALLEIIQKFIGEKKQQ